VADETFILKRGEEKHVSTSYALLHMESGIIYITVATRGGHPVPARFSFSVHFLQVKVLQVASCKLKVFTMSNEEQPVATSVATSVTTSDDAVKQQDDKDSSGNNSKNNKQKSNNTNKSNKKRKRQHKISPEDQLQQEQQERYDKLVYQAKKALHKECKVVKSFECQKVVRRIKDANESKVDNDANKKLLEEKLTLYKNCSLDAVVELGIRRLGLPNLNPKAVHSDDEDYDKKKEVNETTTTTAAAASLSKEESDLMERMLRHKRLVTAVEAWNEKVTEYRRWFLRRKDAVSNIPNFVSNNGLPIVGISKSQKKKLKKLQQQKKDEKDDPTGGLFVSLGGDQAEEDDMGEEEEEEVHYPYGPGSAMVLDGTLRKKNRPGQRSRKAKALAIQAKKEGRVWDSSVNWRPKKQHEDDGDGGDGGDRTDKRSHKNNSKDVKPKKVDSAKIAEMGKTWKEEGKAHPSWAARSSEKTGIVAFAGKKITFD
jgi:hypothetical protein